jgi:hypothetical protein
MDHEGKTKVFQVRMRPSVKTAGERAAKDSNRSLSALMEWALLEHLKAAGYWPPSQDLSHGSAKPRKR